MQTVPHDPIVVNDLAVVDQDISDEHLTEEDLEELLLALYYREPLRDYLATRQDLGLTAGMIRYHATLPEHDDA